MLYVTQAMEPYSDPSDLATIARRLPQYAYDNGYEIRILMPRFGTINERRHRLHEVVRLSGMNIIVDDEDYPLIIKVASLPGARIQVYFLDNDEFFKRKHIFEDTDGKAFDDNVERTAFFCKGVVETVKKFGWAPDIVHCQGLLTSLIPEYLKTVYKNDPIFQESKIVYSVFDDEHFPGMREGFTETMAINDLEGEDLDAFNAGGKPTLHQGGIRFSDAIVKGSEVLGSLDDYITKQEKPTLEWSHVDESPKAILDFYKTLLPEEEESE